MDAKKVSTGPWCTNSHQSSDAAVPAHGWHEANRHIHEQSGALPPPARRPVPPVGGVFVLYIARRVELMTP